MAHEDIVEDLVNAIEDVKDAVESLKSVSIPPAQVVVKPVLTPTVVHVDAPNVRTGDVIVEKAKTLTIRVTGRDRNGRVETMEMKVT